MTQAEEPERVVGRRYRLMAKLGSGGFGHVWRARDEALGVDVAVKQVWLPDTADDSERAERLTRAEREARNAARLRDHPNVVAVHDVFVEDGSPWIVMRLVDGVSLQQAIDAKGRLPVDRVREIAVGVLRALDAAARAGIAHRDVKPANILLAGDGQVLLTDFGIAVHEDDKRLTRTGMIIGTMEYTAPERLNRTGDQGTVSDLFSLGATLYTAVEGCSPFHRTTDAAEMAAVLFDRPPPLEHAGELTDLITGLLEKDPDQRLTVRDALALADPAPKPPPNKGTRPITEPEPPISDGPAGQAPEYHCVRVLRGTTTVQAVAFSPDGRLLATGSNDGAVWLWNPDTGQPIGQPLTGHTDMVLAVAFSPNGRLLASGGADKTVRLWNRATGAPIGLPLKGHTYEVFEVAFSPDGRLLATGSNDHTVRLWNPDTGQPIGQPLTGHTDSVTAMAFSPNGRLLATGSPDRTVRFWNPDTGHSLGQPLIGHTDWVRAVAFSPDGRLLATGSKDRTVRLWNPATRAPIGQPLTGHTDWVLTMAFSPDGALLATGSKDRTVRLWNPATGEPIGHSLTGHTDWVLTMAFSPNGDLLATGGYDNTARLWSP